MNINPLHHFIIPQHKFPEIDDHVKKIQAAAIDMTDNLIVQAITQAAKEDGVTDLYLIDKKFAAEAIREKLERENPQPLTIEELGQMNGEPVYIEGLGWRVHHGLEVFMGEHHLYTGMSSKINLSQNRVNIYRHKPKEAKG